MSDGQRTMIPERLVQGRPLGRHINHDARSRNFRARTATLRSVTHKRYCPAFDQGNLGSCTGNAAVGAAMAAPLWIAGRVLTEVDCVEVYSRATAIDPFPGKYPPEDTGSDGLSVAKVMRDKGWVTEYRWAFGLDDALAALVVAPLLIGINWYSSFDTPTSTGRLVMRDDAYVRGGHELVLTGISVSHRTVDGWNSWGPGFARLGRFTMGWKLFGRLLDEGGDATQLIKE